MLMEAKSKYSPNIKPYLRTHDILDAVDGFSHISLNYNMIPPIKIKTKPTIFIMKRKPNALVGIARIEKVSEEVIEVGNTDERLNEDLEKKDIARFDEDIEKDEIYRFEEDEEKEIEMSSSVGEIEENEDLITEDSIPQEIEEVKIIEDVEVMPKKRTEPIDKKINKVEMRLLEAKLEEIQREINEKRQLEEKIGKIERKIIRKSEESLENSAEVNEKIKADKKILRKSEEIPENSIEIEEKIKVDERIIRKSEETLENSEEVEEKIKLDKKNLRISEETSENSIEGEEKTKVDKKIPKKSAETSENSIEMEEKIKVDKKIPKKSSEIGLKPPKFDKKSHKKISPESPEPLREDNELKLAIRKLIHTKKEELEGKPQNLEDSPKIETKVKRKTVELPKPLPEVKKSVKIATVKDSIKNIINQFKEFEKDLASEDPESMKKWSSLETLDSSESIDKIGAVSLEANLHEVDKLIIESDDPLIINDAKKSLKEIIDQFRILRNELSIEADDKFEEIAEKFMERPISETLVYFSEALRDLMDKRKEKVRRDEKVKKSGKNGKRRSQGVTR